MMDDARKKARSKSLEDLMAAMDEDSANSIPGIKGKSDEDDAGSPGPDGHPILRIEIDGVGDSDSAEDVDPDTDDLPPAYPDGSTPGAAEDPFEELIRRKKAERK